MQVSIEPLQKLLWIFAAASGLVIVQYNGRQPIHAGTVNPHVRLGLSSLAVLFENLHHRLICMQNFSLQKFFPHGIPQRLQPVFRTPDDPARHGGPAECYPQLFPCCFLPVQRHGIHILLVHDFCHHRSRNQTVIQQRLWNGSPHNDTAAFFVAGLALVTHLPVPDQLQFGPLVFKDFPHQLFPDPNQFSFTPWTDPLFFVQVVDAIFCLIAAGQFPASRFAYLVDAPLVLFERFRGVFLVFQLSFREYAQRFFFLLHRRRLAGAAKPFLLQQGNHLFQVPDFFQKKPHGFLQVLDVSSEMPVSIFCMAASRKISVSHYTAKQLAARAVCTENFLPKF